MTAIQTHFSKALIFALAGALMAHGATLSGTVSGGKGAAVSLRCFIRPRATG